MRGLYHSDCKSCAQLFDFYNELSKSGGRITGGNIVFTKAPRVQVDTPRDVAFINTFTHTPAVQQVDAEGKVVTEFAATDSSRLWSLIKRDGKWLIARVQEIK